MGLIKRDNNMKRFFVLTSVIILIAISGCGKVSAPTLSSSSNDYYPHADGYSWSYLLSYSATSETILLHSTFSGTKIIDSFTAQIMKNEMSADGTTTTYETCFVSNDSAVLKYSKGPAIAYPDGGITTEALTLFRFPLKVGNSWYCSPNLSIEAQVESQEVISVPAGIFNCFRIGINTYLPSDPKVYQYTYWLAANVGIIKATAGYSHGGVRTTTSTQELNSKNF